MVSHVRDGGSTVVYETPTKIECFNRVEWVFEDMIYKGTNATVYRIRNIRTHVSGVLKKYSKIYLSTSNKEKVKNIFETELKCIKLLHGNKYIPPVWYYYETTIEMGLVMKYMTQGTLRKYINTFTCNKCAMAFVIYPLLKAIRSIHALGIIHRDIKPDNIFIHKNQIYIGDYGYSHIEPDYIKAYGIVGTLQYMAPEILKAYLDNDVNVEYHKGVDIWAIGMIAYELLYHTKPFYWRDYKTTHVDIRIFIMRCISSSVTFPRVISDEIKDFLSRCLEKEPSKRATIEELLEHSWVLNYLKDRRNINEKCLQQSFLSIPTPSQTMTKRQISKMLHRFHYRSLQMKTPLWKKICTIS